MNLSNTECYSRTNEDDSLILFIGFYGLLIIQSIYLCIKQIGTLTGWMKI
jgi:hypothetical protein